ncbi:hypothetical protein ACFQ21_11840 [Ohtaekwangia kribbensis]|jgi:hypothetical protein|uniref:DUF3592 domain-containing protein n=1 Tax=Ohtaekwangia kribbensis TaxID=688913 RepID=A0ABW3K440_9BACT
MNYQSREVKTATIFRLLKQKPGLLLVGSLLTGLPIFMITLFTLIISLTDADFNEVDYEKINRHGKVTSAKVTGIEEQTNVAVNDQHPIVIYYSYTTNDSTINATFRTLESRKVSNLNTGDQIEIKYIESESIITGLEPFKFPLNMVYLIVMPLLVPGIIVWIILLLYVRKALKLYKHGRVKEAELIALISKAGSIFSGLAPSMILHYKYETSRGQKVIGKSTTNDYAVVNTLKSGDLVKIFVSHENEQQSCYIPRLESEYNDWRIY